MKPFSSFLLVLLLGLLTTGCGGGAGGGSGTSNNNGTSRGQVTVHVRWPERPASRQIPASANSVRVIVRSGSRDIVDRLLVRPSVEDTLTTEIISDLPQATLNVEAEAFPNADGTGVAQAHAVTTVTVRGNEATDLNLTMDSTIARVAILPDSMPISSPMIITAAAFDAQNNLILTDHWQWASTNTGVIRVEPNGGTATLTAVGPGEARIVLTETESGVKVERVFNVKPL